MLELYMLGTSLKENEKEKKNDYTCLFAWTLCAVFCGVSWYGIYQVVKFIFS